MSWKYPLEDLNMHWNISWKCFVGNSYNLTHKIHGSCFAFQGVKVKIIENLEGKQGAAGLPEAPEPRSLLLSQRSQ